MISSKGAILLFITLSGLFNSGYADITDMIGEAICAAQCLANFTMSVSPIYDQVLTSYCYYSYSSM